MVSAVTGGHHVMVSRCHQGYKYVKKNLLVSTKKHLLFLFLCVLSLCVLKGWLIGLKANISHSLKHKNITVLLWNWPFGSRQHLEGDVCWDLYHIPRCRLVDRRYLYMAADVVVFHNREMIQGLVLPLELPRPKGQRWAWMSLEAPRFNGNLTNYGNIFNLTISYRRDADITTPYGEMLPKEVKGGLEKHIPLNKSALVCWVVSNYRSSHRRSKVYNQLRALVPVQVYGRWAYKPLPSTALLRTISRCYFYLAFENSIAKDYITEKLWRNAYEARAVPVVLGPPLQDYQAVAPPDSFIHVDNFSSPEDLGAYLLELAGDENRYNEYFKWRNKWDVKLHTGWRERLCKICAEYNNLPQYQVYTDLNAWVYYDDLGGRSTQK